MTVLTRWEPFREFSTLQDRINRVFRDSYSGAGQDEAGRDETRGERSAAACHIFSDAKVAAPCRDGYRNVLHGPSRVESQFTHAPVSRRWAIERRQLDFHECHLGWNGLLKLT